jgi:hypothetical protein
MLKLCLIVSNTLLENFFLIINIQSYLLSFNLITAFNKVKNIKLVINNDKNYTLYNFTPGDKSPSSTPRQCSWVVKNGIRFFPNSSANGVMTDRFRFHIFDKIRPFSTLTICSMLSSLSFTILALEN